jgi:hypothetical protein
MLYYEEE